ncbi:hypothetical protein SEA_LUCKYSOCKE_212 [Streptomyces phage LuckySocke]|jgi:hypothetical protein|nr:hypothetical protein SEA_LUCKYSOCKE_212 [Streptomyces phage LuckySocke]
MTTSNPNRVRVHALCGRAHSVTDTECPPAPNMCDVCGVSQGSREWCEYCGLDTTPPREPLSASESDERTTGEGEPTYTLTGLSDDDVSLLVEALYALNNHAERGPTYDRCMSMIDRLYRTYDS